MSQSKIAAFIAAMKIDVPTSLGPATTDPTGLFGDTPVHARVSADFEEVGNFAVLLMQYRAGIAGPAIEKLNMEELLVLERYLVRCDTEEAADSLMQESRALLHAFEDENTRMQEKIQGEEFIEDYEDMSLRANILGRWEEVLALKGSFERAMLLQIRLLDAYSTSIDGGKKYVEARKARDPTWVKGSNDKFFHAMQARELNMVEEFDGLDLDGCSRAQHAPARTILEMHELSFVAQDGQFVKDETMEDEKIEKLGDVKLEDGKLRDGKLEDEKMKDEKMKDKKRKDEKLEDEKLEDGKAQDGQIDVRKAAGGKTGGGDVEMEKVKDEKK